MTPDRLSQQEREEIFRAARVYVSLQVQMGREPEMTAEQFEQRVRACAEAAIERSQTC